MTDIREIKDKLYALEQDDLTPEEAGRARADLKGLFMYLANHGFTTPIPSIVRLMEFLDNITEDYICPECHNEAREYGYCSHCGSDGVFAAPGACKSCGGSGRVQVPCTSGMPGCLVYHTGPCPSCNLPPAK